MVSLCATRASIRGRGTAVRIDGKIAITIIGYQPGVENTKPPLREVAAHMLAEFGLAGEID